MVVGTGRMWEVCPGQFSMLLGVGPYDVVGGFGDHVDLDNHVEKRLRGVARWPSIAEILWGRIVGRGGAATWSDPDASVAARLLWRVFLDTPIIAQQGLPVWGAGSVCHHRLLMESAFLSPKLEYSMTVELSSICVNAWLI